ncbi:MAG: hypothetical protein ABT19_02685 [Rhodanobacter sp. SCN 68-63]|nr:MAG: hypothetical protein ABT19_02685 [Rhodanobacter sp. SCN 68-63]
MAHYVLRDDISYCRIGERFVFLDIDSDRYFHLPGPLEQALMAHLDGAGCSSSQLDQLIERDILVHATGAASANRPSIRPVARSAMETASQPQRFRLSERLEVFAAVLVARIALKFSTLKKILEGLKAARRVRTTSGTRREDFPERQILDASAAFRRARLYVPIDMRCLLDSLAMTRFLLRRGIPAHIVFGVALDPFSAHCWVQVDDLVLNDSVGNVASHTPIRIV